MRKRICYLGILIVLLTIFAVLLSRCGRKKPTPTVVPLPERTPKPTFTPLPTDTLVPTLTPTHTATEPPPTLTPTPKPTLNPNASPLTGLHVDDPALRNRRVLAMRIGNDPIIRPQDGLGLADVVYEEIMEGWVVTRFTALYLTGDVERIRPLRSARLSNLYITPQYDAALVHSGASDEIRYRLSQASFVNLDQYYDPAPFSIMPGYDWRGRMYTSMQRIYDYLRKKGLGRETAIEGYAFDPRPPAGGPATSIHIPYQGKCAVDWRYDAEIGSYLRWQDDEPHLEGLTKEQIAAQNVIVFYVEHKKTDIVEDSLGSTAIDIVVAGSGRAQVCRDGVAVEAAWKQDSPGALIQYYDENDQLIPLHPGKTWIQLVPLDYEVTIR